MKESQRGTEARDSYELPKSVIIYCTIEPKDASEGCRFLNVAFLYLTRAVKSHPPPTYIGKAWG
jgi:hypothetical protein